MAATVKTPRPEFFHTFNDVLSKYGDEVRRHVVQILATYDIPLNDPLAAVISMMFATNLENIKKIADAPDSYQSKIQTNIEHFTNTARQLEFRQKLLRAQRTPSPTV